MSRNVSEPLRGPRQTNQRAELTAVARALDHVPIDRAVLIHTDSNYSIKCLTEWFQNWEKRNWKSSSGKDVENRDLIEPILARIREREMCRARTSFKWVKGHANDPGNVAADMLAVQGSRNSTPGARGQDVKDISATLKGPSMADFDGATDYEEIFKDTDEEASFAPPSNHVHSTFTNDQLSGVSSREGHDYLHSAVNGHFPSLKTEATDAMDIVQGKVEET